MNLAGSGSGLPSGDLETLARARFGNLTRAEEQLLRGAPTGQMAICGPNANPDDPANDPNSSDEWGNQRGIRAELISWLCVDAEASKKIGPLGMQVGGASIEGRLDLLFITVSFPLLFTCCRFRHDIDLKFSVLPALNLQRSSIEGLVLDGAQIRGDVTLDGVTSSGEVRALQAHIGGSFSCSGGKFRNTGRESLSLDRADIKGSVYIDAGFAADGEVRLAGVQIGCQLVCDSAFLTEVTLQGAVIKDSFVWHDIKNIKQLILMNSSTAAMTDDAASWPERGGLVLDGFIYKRFVGGPTDAKTRLAWLERQGEFKPQPYFQLALVLRETGDDRGARRALFEMEDQWRKIQDHAWYQQLWSQILRKSIGYGHMSWRALAWLVILSVIGCGVFGCGYLGGAMAPTEEKAYKFFEEHGFAPTYYPQFNPLIYSIERSFPLLNLGVKDHWTPNHGTSADVLVLHGRGSRWMHDVTVRGVHVFRWNVPAFLRLCSWIQIPLGWALATLFVAGLTGIVKK